MRLADDRGRGLDVEYPTTALEADAGSERRPADSNRDSHAATPEPAGAIMTLKIATAWPTNQLPVGCQNMARSCDLR